MRSLAVRYNAWSSSQRELPPKALTDTDVNVSIHPAPIIQPFHPNSLQCAKIHSWLPAILDIQCVALRHLPFRRLYFRIAHRVRRPSRTRKVRRIADLQ